jgi:hypothetical protein
MTFVLEPIMALAAGVTAGAGPWGASLATAGTMAGAFPAAPAAAGAMATAGTITSILEGTASVLGIVSSIAAGNADAEAAEAAARDADGEQAVENLQGISRRRSLRLAALEAMGDMDVANAASGVDLSFGTAAQAQTEALRELDLALTSDAGTQQTRVARLQERAASYRRTAKRARTAGLVGGLSAGVSTLQRIAGRR